MALSFSDSELAAYLEEDLDAERASALEQALPGDELLLQRLQTIRQQNDSGEHTLDPSGDNKASVAQVVKLSAHTCLGSYRKNKHCSFVPTSKLQVHHLPCRCRRFAATANSESRNEGKRVRQNTISPVSVTFHNVRMRWIHESSTKDINGNPDASSHDAIACC